MTKSTIKVLGTTWCYDTHIVLDFFHENGIDYEWIDIDQSDEAEQLVLKINDGYRSVPTILLADGSTMTEPSRQELERYFLSQS